VVLSKLSSAGSKGQACGVWMVRPPALCWFLVLTVPVWLLMYLWLPEVINSEYQLTSVGFWRSVRSVRVIERRSNYLCLWGSSNFAKLISLETFGCIKQPFFHNLLTLLNLQHWIDYQLDFPSIANFFQPPYFPRRVIFFLAQRFTCTPIQNPGSRTTYAVLMSSIKEERNSCLRLQSSSVEVLSVSCWCLAKSNLSM